MIFSAKSFPQKHFQVKRTKKSIFKAKIKKPKISDPAHFQGGCAKNHFLIFRVKKMATGLKFFLGGYLPLRIVCNTPEVMNRCSFFQTKKVFFCRTPPKNEDHFKIGGGVGRPKKHRKMDHFLLQKKNELRDFPKNFTESYRICNATSDQV